MSRTGAPVSAPATPRPAPAPPAMAVRGLAKTFGGTVAVDDVGLDVRRAEVLALVGPSGCGKSTVLRLLAGLLRPDAGTIRLDGDPAAGPRAWVPPERRPTGIVFQDPALFPNLTVRDNVAFGLRGLDATARAVRVRETLGLVELDGYGDRYPHELSGGERQRVSLARSLAPRPALLLLDEPFANLDQQLRSQLRGEVVGILRDAGTAGIFVTHDQHEALAVGDRLAVMRAGRLEQVDAPGTVFHQPTSRFVATFMGAASFLPIEGREGGELVTEAGRCPAPATAPPAGASVMVRPHEVRLSPHPDGPATVVGSEFQGAFVRYAVELPSGRRLESLEPHVLVLEPGQRVRLDLDHGHVPAVLG